MYNKDIDINPRYYTLIEKDAAKTLAQLSKNYKLVACSLAAKEITIKKLKKTGLLKYFSGIIEKSDSILANEEAIFVDDRPQNFGNNIIFIRFCYGQHQKMNASPHLEINSIKELNLTYYEKMIDKVFDRFDIHRVEQTDMFSELNIPKKSKKENEKNIINPTKSSIK